MATDIRWGDWGRHEQGGSRGLTGESDGSSSDISTISFELMKELDHAAAAIKQQVRAASVRRRGQSSGQVWKPLPCPTPTRSDAMAVKPFCSLVALIL